MIDVFRNVRSWILCLLIAIGPTLNVLSGGAGVLEIRNGYFWDPVKGEYFVPRGIAYQTWNPPVGANQSFEQLDYDLLEFKKMHVNSIRCEFVWSQVQTGPETWDWQRSDHLVQQAEKLGLKLFVIIGFQYPPPWFPPEWRGINNLGLTPEVLQCLGSRQPGSVTNCLTKPIYDHLFTNDFPAEVIQATLASLTSSVPSEIIGAIKQKVPADLLSRVLSGFVSDVINYEDPNARRIYTNHIAKVVERYKNNQAIGAWIMGNECAYFDLWESYTTYPVHRFIGYDLYSQAAFRSYLEALYGGNVAALNANWQSSYPDFASVQMPHAFPSDRTQAHAYPDLIHWRQQSIGNFLAAGVRTARLFDPNHLLTYSMVGGIFSGLDANNTCEDAPAIVAACKAAGAPLDFWSINNYAWASYGSELRSGDFGVSKYRELVGLPVMISETGHSSSENFFDGAAPRQAKAIPGQIWESLISGAIGTHIFHWNDRNQFRGDFLREKGFGIVNEDRTPKVPVYQNVVRMFRRMQEIGIENLLGSSADPPTDVQFFWSSAADVGWPRANQENAMLWGALRRVGLQPGLMDDAEFRNRAYTNSQVVLLSRAWQLHPADLQTIASEVVTSGLSIHANADLPGQFDAYLRPNPQWAGQMRALFGIDVANAIAAYDSGGLADGWEALRLFGTLPGKVLATNDLRTWKIWHGVRAVAGNTVLRHTGLKQTQQNPPVPALQFHALGSAKTALNTFALGDSYATSTPESKQYDLRYDIVRAIYRDHFGIKPTIDISGPGAKRVLADYRVCRNGSVLLSILNVDTNIAEITVAAPQLLTGRTVEDLTSGGVLELNSDGVLNFTLPDDEYVLLYAFGPGNAADASLINPNPEKLSFESSPMAVWPSHGPTNATVGYAIPGTDTLSLRVTLEQVRPAQRTFAESSPKEVQGQGTVTLSFTVPDPDLNDPGYLSSADGGEYILRAKLDENGRILSETSLPIRLLWGIRPTAPLPREAAPGGIYQVALEWEELPSYDSSDWLPLNRALLWESLSANTQFYNLVLQLRDGSGQVVAADTFNTSQATGERLFNIAVPQTASGPWSWEALLQAAPQTVSLDLDDGFEGRHRGEDLAPFNPWYGDHYSELNNVSITSQGILTEESDRDNKVAYLTVNNPVSPGAYSGFFLIRGAAQAWALPANRSLWGQYSFAFDFKERNSLQCVLELQLKDTSGNWISFMKPYTPKADGWDTIEANLSQFSAGSSPGVFDPSRIREWVLNIQMLQPGTTYEGYFDNVVFVGPQTISDDFQNREVFADYDRVSPWFAYGYDAAGHRDVLLNSGVGLTERSEGSQAAFLVSEYRQDSGEFAGFGLGYAFPHPWALPSRASQWRNYSFSFDFKERFAQRCILELQITSPDSLDADGRPIKHALSYTKEYTPGSNQWDTITATLDQFTQPDHFGRFDPTKVTGLVMNVQMVDRSETADVLFVGWFDNVHFDAPEPIAPGEGTYGVYLSANDSFRIQAVVQEGDSLVISWVGEGVLERASQIDGPWESLPQSRSPASIPLAGPAGYFRLRR